jgi:hypothetical protein
VTDHLIISNDKDFNSVKQKKIYVSVTPDALPCKVYPMTQKEDKGLLKFLNKQEAKGYIRPSISPYASPFFFIQKKDGKLWPVQDY